MRGRILLVLIIAALAILTTAHLDDGAPRLRVPAERSASLVAPPQAPLLASEGVSPLVLPEGAYVPTTTIPLPELAYVTTTTAAPTTTTTEPPTTTTEAPTTTTEPPTTTSAPEPEPESPHDRTPEPEPESTTTVAHTSAPGGGWEDLRQCESGGDYTAYQRGGPGRGAYQFEPPTWDGVVARMGRPDLVGVNPAEASPADQDAAALWLYSERGAQPWPYCGRYL